MLCEIVLSLLLAVVACNPFPGAIVHDDPYASAYNGPNDYGSNSIGAGGLAPVGGYDIGYEVNSPKHGNLYNHREISDNDGVVSGSYSLVESDGSLRTVDYVADWVNGFRATVRDKNGVRHHGYVPDKTGKHGDGYGKH